MESLKRWCYRPFRADSTFSRLLKPIGKHPGFFLFAAIVPTRSLVNDRFDNTRPRPLLLGYEPAGDYDVLIRE